MPSLPPLPCVQVTRSQLEAWFLQPFFEADRLNGCVVRMAYGPGLRDNSGNVHPGYMLMEVCVNGAAALSGQSLPSACHPGPPSCPHSVRLGVAHAAGMQGRRG